MIKFIYFDIGKVLNPSLFRKWRKEIIKKSGKSMNGLNKIFEKNWFSYMKGEMQDSEFWKLVCNYLELEENYVKEKLRKRFKVNWYLKYFIWRNKKKYRFGIISNNTPFTQKLFEDNFNLNNFEVLIFSQEVHLVKPGKEIYQLAIKKTNIKPSEILFIDDKESNVNAAKELGINGFVFENNKQFRREFKQYERIK